jgi:endonuclease-3 related protein
VWVLCGTRLYCVDGGNRDGWKRPVRTAEPTPRLAPVVKKPAIKGIYGKLLAAYGPQDWWPAEEPFEVIVGAILTQSTSWRNAALAIDCLKTAGAMTPPALRALSHEELARLVYSSGYYNAKADKLRAVAVWLGETYADDIGAMSAAETAVLRRQLLGVHGIGEETADSIILYAANQPTFVIDAYSRRILGRLGLTPRGDSYHAYQLLFMESLPADAALFNEYHALLVRHGKDVCRPRPLCGGCCLRGGCRFSEVNQEE